MYYSGSKNIMQNEQNERDLSFRTVWSFFLLLTLLFTTSCITGLYHAKSNPSEAKERIEMLFAEFRIVKEIHPILIFTYIFLRNSINTLIATAAGFFFGLFPLFFVFINGYIVGLVIYVKGIEMGFGKVLLYILPHGVIEIPAILLANSYGVWLGKQFYGKLRGRSISMKTSFLAVFRKYLRIVVPLLLLAAMVEAFITPLVITFIT